MSIEIRYTRVGDYLLPNIAAAPPSPGDDEPLGRYARMHRVYLKEHRLILYNQLLLSGKLYPILREIDESANARLQDAEKMTEYERNVIVQGIIADLVYT
jgi:hypothetical protein